MKRNLCCFQIPFVACVWHSVYIAFQPDLPKSRHCNPILKYHRYTNIHTSFIVISALPQIKKTHVDLFFLSSHTLAHCHLKVYHSQWWLSTIAWQKVIASSQSVHFGGVLFLHYFEHCAVLCRASISRTTEFSSISMGSTVIEMQNETIHVSGCHLQYNDRQLKFDLVLYNNHKWHVFNSGKANFCDFFPCSGVAVRLAPYYECAKWFIKIHKSDKYLLDAIRYITFAIFVFFFILFSSYATNKWKIHSFSIHKWFNRNN